MIRYDIRVGRDKALYAYQEAVEDCFANARDDNQRERAGKLIRLAEWLEMASEGVFPCHLRDLPQDLFDTATHVLIYARANERLDEGEIVLAVI